MRKIAATVATVIITLVLATGDAGATTQNARTTGFPTSSNRASSMHLNWSEAPAPALSVSAVVTIPHAPESAHLYFWALQVDFLDTDGKTVGGAHLGLQWHPSYPGNTAVNFGGYAPTDKGHVVELAGDVSPLPSADGNPNTRDFAWSPGRSYRLTISGSGDGRWNGTVTDVATGATTMVRRLHGGGVHIGRPAVWTESFAPCGESGVTAVWSKLEPAPKSVYATYQSFENGGCTNTNAESTPDGFAQQTNTTRVTAGYETLRFGW